jgi:hypothetical protein
MIDERMIGDIAALEPMYVDDCHAALNLGTNVNLVFFRYAPVAQEGGAVRFERVSTLSLVIPWASTICKRPQLVFSSALQGGAPSPFDPAAVRRSQLTFN